eukprot:3829570-Amphidinium_carterae.1
MRNYCYLIVNTLEKTGIAIDAAWNIDAMYDLTAKLGIELLGYHCRVCLRTSPNTCILQDIVLGVKAAKEIGVLCPFLLQFTMSLCRSIYTHYHFDHCGGSRAELKTLCTRCCAKRQCGLLFTMKQLLQLLTPRRFAAMFALQTVV